MFQLHLNLPSWNMTPAFAQSCALISFPGLSGHWEEGHGRCSSFAKIWNSHPVGNVLPDLGICRADMSSATNTFIVSGSCSRVKRNLIVVELKGLSLYSRTKKIVTDCSSCYPRIHSRSNISEVSLLKWQKCMGS